MTLQVQSKDPLLVKYSSSISRHSESSPKLLLSNDGSTTVTELLLWHMFCKHHLNSQYVTELKLREVNLTCSTTERWVLIHTRVCPCPNRTSGPHHHGPLCIHMVLQDLLCSESLWTRSWQAFEWQVFTQSCKDHQLWRKDWKPYNVWWALLDYAWCRPLATPCYHF